MHCREKINDHVFGEREESYSFAALIMVIFNNKDDKFIDDLYLQHAIIKPQQPKYLSTNFTLLPEKLKQAGYSTHIVGK